MTRNPVDRLLAMGDRLSALGGDAAVDAAWLFEGVAAYVIQGEDAFVRALGLAGALGRSPRYAYLLRKRNGHLRAALYALGGRYAGLATEIAIYETRVPAVLRAKSAAQPGWSEARRYIHSAAFIGLGLPRGEPGLRKALREETEPPPVQFREAAP